MITTKSAHLRRLQGVDGYFRILAIDHRTVYYDLLHKALEREPDDEEIFQTKEDIIRFLSPFASAVLVDPAHAARNKPFEEASIPEYGLLLSIEGNDYSTCDFSEDYLMPGVTVKRIKEMGADCVKLFLYYRSDSPFADKQREIIGCLADECGAEQIPFLVEPIVFSLGPAPLSPEEKAALTLQAVRDLGAFDIDILKIEFPGDLRAFSPQKNLEICRSVTDGAHCPWILLSSGVDTNVLNEQLAISMQAGACGFAVGRTIWQPYLTAPLPEKRIALNNMVEQFNMLCRLY